jgi:hypothetical protein
MTLEKVTLIASVITGLFGLIGGGGIVAIWKSRRESFINTVTIARKEYIEQTRKSAADFIAAAIAVSKNRKDIKHRMKMRETGAGIKLRLNPMRYAGLWDGELNKLICCIENSQSKKKIREFIALMQSLLALEWKGMMDEGTRGVLSEDEKLRLRYNFWRQYLDYKEKTKNGF